MRKHLRLALFIFVLPLAGCSGCSGCSKGDKAPAPESSASVFDEAFCKESLQRCVETIKANAAAYGKLNETRKLCPGLTSAKDVVNPLSAAELAKVDSLARNTTDCRADLETCRGFRTRAVKTLSDGMQELANCDKR